MKILLTVSFALFFIWVVLLGFVIVSNDPISMTVFTLVVGIPTFIGSLLFVAGGMRIITRIKIGAQKNEGGRNQISPATVWDTVFFYASVSAVVLTAQFFAALFGMSCAFASGGCDSAPLWFSTIILLLSPIAGSIFVFSRRRNIWEAIGFSILMYMGVAGLVKLVFAVL